MVSGTQIRAYPWLPPCYTVDYCYTITPESNITDLYLYRAQGLFVRHVGAHAVSSSGDPRNLSGTTTVIENKRNAVRGTYTIH